MFLLKVMVLMKEKMMGPIVRKIRELVKVVEAKALLVETKALLVDLVEQIVPYQETKQYLNALVETKALLVETKAVFLLKMMFLILHTQETM